MDELINIENKDGELVVSSREVARNFEKQHSEILKRIQGYDRNGEHINGLLDDMDSSVNTLQYFIPSEYKDASGKSNIEYLLPRDGFSLLVMGFTGQRALEWKLKYIEAFNAMEQQLTNMNNLSPQLQLLINLELGQKQMQQQISQVNQRVDGIKEIVGLSTIGWRDDARALIVKIAEQWGGNKYIAEVNRMIYQELNKRMGVNLKQRRTNKRHRMADEGASKSKQEKVSYVDVIAEDKKLVEGYMAIVKEMAVKYGVADEGRIHENAKSEYGNKER